MLAGLIDWLEGNMMPCMYKKYIGIDCPGCGMQRAFIELLKGNFAESFKIYPALLPVLFTFALTASYLVFRYRNGAKYIMWSFIFSAIIITGSFIIKKI
jgi:hypothetical protein